MNKIKGNKQIQADLMMIAVTIFWGSSYLFMKVSLESIEAFSLIFLRFIIAFLLSSCVFYKRLMKVNVATLKYAFILGTLLFAAYAFLTVGLPHTSTSNAGFLVSLAVVFVPVISTLLLKEKMKKNLILGVSVALIGIALLTLNSELHLSLGDVLCIVCALLYSCHIILTSQFTNKVDSIALGIWQLLFCGIWAFLFSFTFETTSFPTDLHTWGAVLVLSIVCTAIGFIIQTIAQKHTTATHTGLIFSLEPIFAAIFAYIFIGEILSTKGYIGAALVLTGILISEFNFTKLFIKKPLTERHI